MKRKPIVNSDIAKVLFSEKQISTRVKALAAKITKDYKGKELTVVSILKGSIVFASDLIRQIDIKTKVDFISVASYNGTKSSGIIKMLMDLRQNPAGRHLLLVDEIVDSGRTLEFLLKNIKSRQPASVKTCVLLDKKSKREVSVKVDYTGFSVEDKFVVGYGLDYNEMYRNLPYIGILKKEITDN